MQKQSRRFLLLGASRGLGWATYLALNTKYPDSQFFLSSRKIENNNVTENTKKVAQDFSLGSVGSDFFKQIQEFQPTEMIYFAGGGPYGIFQNKKWSDHQWAMNVNFLYPAELIHQILCSKNNFLNLKSVTVIGSDIAEYKPDSNAASYAAAKHALRGLMTTLQTENSTAIKFKLFSPGYMLTALLPVNSAPRNENRATNPVVAAENLVEFIISDQLIWSESANRLL